jgi:hypothetical protein
VFALKKEVKQGRQTLLHRSFEPASGLGPTANPTGVLMWWLMRAPRGVSNWPGSNGSGTSRCKFDRRQTLLKGGIKQVERTVHRAVFGEVHTGAMRGSVELGVVSDEGRRT